MKRYVVDTNRIIFTNVTDSKGVLLADGGHHGSRAGGHFHNKLISDVESANSKLEAKKIIGKHHREHMRLKGC